MIESVDGRPVRNAQDALAQIAQAQARHHRDAWCGSAASSASP